MPLGVVGLNHRTAPVEIRERFAVGRGRVAGVLEGWLAQGDVSEAVLLSTCNRTELYYSAPDPIRAAASARRLLGDQAALAPERTSALLYHRADREAASHLFRVTAGLDSLVPGEAEIQGQVKEAYALAGELGPPIAATGPVLNRLFQTALGTAGRARAQTGLGEGAASVPSAAVELARKIFGRIRGRRALVLGAGEMSATTLACLRSEGVRTALVANRSFERARELAAEWDAEALRLDEVGRVLGGVDILVASTSAPHPVLTCERFRAALPEGPSRPLCILDIAIPRDVELGIGDLPNVFLYNVDDLRQIVDHNLSRRRAELPRAEAVLSGGVEEFWAWYSSLEVVPTIRDLRERAERVRRDEVEQALSRLRHLPREDREAIDVLTRSLLNKVLHSPTVRLREAVGNGRGTPVLDLVRYLFELDGESRDDA